MGEMSEMSLNGGSASSSMGSMGAEAAAAAAAAARTRGGAQRVDGARAQPPAGRDGQAVADAADEAAADAYWAALCEGGKEHDAATRRFLIPGAAAASPEGLVRLWISCVLGAPLPTEGDFEPLLRSGKLLCKFLNAIGPASCRVSRRTPSSWRWATRSATQDAREHRAVHRRLRGARAPAGGPLHAGRPLRGQRLPLGGQEPRGADALRHRLDPGYKGPLVGKQLKKNITPAKVHAQVAPPRVVLSGGKGPSGIVGRG